MKQKRLIFSMYYNDDIQKKPSQILDIIDRAKKHINECLSTGSSVSLILTDSRGVPVGKMQTTNRSSF